MATQRQSNYKISSFRDALPTRSVAFSAALVFACNQTATRRDRALVTTIVVPRHPVLLCRPHGVMIPAIHVRSDQSFMACSRTIEDRQFRPKSILLSSELRLSPFVQAQNLVRVGQVVPS
jgi:hypothetical protein